MAAWGRYTGAEFAPVNHRAGLPTSDPTVRLTQVTLPAGQHRPEPPVVRSRFGTGDFRLLPAALGVLTALVVIALVVVGIVGWPVYRDTHRHLVLGESLVGLNRMSDDGGTAVSVWGSFRQGMPGVTNVLAGSYASADSGKLAATIVVGRRLTLRPAEQGRATMTGLANHAEPVDYHTGPLGGFIQCAAANADKYERTYCLWVDHGTAGFAVFYGRTVSESAELFGKARQQITVP